jgi:hypothetical protein
MADRNIVVVKESTKVLIAAPGPQGIQGEAGSGGGATYTTPTRQVTNNTTLANTDGVVACTGTLTVTIPLADSLSEKPYFIKNMGTGIITLNCSGAETIDGSATWTLESRYDCAGIIPGLDAWRFI